MRQRRHSMWALLRAMGLAALSALPCPVMLCSVAVSGQTVTVRGRVEVDRATTLREKKSDAKKPGDHKSSSERKPIDARRGTPSTVVWLTAAAGSGVELDPPAPNAAGNPRLVQKNKSFEPHLLVVPAGSTVEFPNHDPFFHNVFSLFEGKRFDLGLYEAGTTRMVRFDRPGISYIFCNIHPEMSAVVITMATPLYAIAGTDGQISIANVQPGRYILHIWSEGMPENEKPATREITIGESATSLGVIRVPEANGLSMAHKNKYGREYDAPMPDSSIYKQQ